VIRIYHVLIASERIRFHRKEGELNAINKAVPSVEYTPWEVGGVPNYINLTITDLAPQIGQTRFRSKHYTTEEEKRNKSSKKT
jgi:hypothetical protein